MFNNYAKDNQIIAGSISIWALTVISYLLKNIPRSITDYIKKQSTTSLVIVSTSNSYHSFIKWIDYKGFTKKFRNIKMSNGIYGEGNTVKSIGYGKHYLFYKWRLLIITMSKLDKVTSSMEQDEIRITILGRSHNFFNKLHKSIDKFIEDKEINKIPVFKSNESHWYSVNSQRNRNFNTIHLSYGIKEKIINHITEFKNNEKWYLDNGVPYQTGILLYGIPGSGKTSLIKSIATKFNMKICILGSLLHINRVITSLPENSILLIEDIDSNSITYKRDRNNPSNEIKEEIKNTDKIVSQFMNLGDILNAIDGIVVNHGRILIATTNYKENLDPAIIRNGRFDLKIELGYVDKYILNGFFKQYYPDFKIPSEFKIINNLYSAKLQNLILKNINNPQNVLKQIEE